MNEVRVKYTGSTPGANSNTYVIFDSTVAFPGANYVQGAGLKRIGITFDHIYAGTVNLYRSANRGATWEQLDTQAQFTPPAAGSSYYDVNVEAFADFKVEWVNGGTAQDPWSVDIVLTDDSSSLWTFEGEMARFGAVAHYDPSFGVTDDGTTMTWLDRIGKYDVASTSQATKPTLTASVTAFNGRPGVTFAAASSHKLISSTDALALLFNGNQPFTAFIVRKNTTNVGFQCSASFGHASAVDDYVVWAATTNGAMFAGRAQTSATSATGSVTPTTTACLDAFAWDGTNYTGRESGVASIASTTGGGAAQAPVVNRFAVGGFFAANAFSSFFNGVIGDIVLFRSQLTAAQIVRVERAVVRKYAFTW